MCIRDREVHATTRLERAFGAQLVNPATAFGYKEPSLVWYFDDGQGYRWGFPRRGLPKTSWATIERRRWRIDDDSLGHLVKGTAVEPTKDRSEQFRELTAAGWEPVGKVVGWSPATSSIVEIWALQNPDPPAD